MRSIKTLRTIGMMATALALVATATQSASADPGFVPDNDDIVIVGSGTNDLVLNDLAALYNSRTPAPTKRLASFDSVGSPTIQIRPGVTINRPRIDDAAIQVVCDTSGVDAAGSSRGSALGDCADLFFLPFAVDEVRWMANDDVTNVPR